MAGPASMVCPGLYPAGRGDSYRHPAIGCELRGVQNVNKCVWYSSTRTGNQSITGCDQCRRGPNGARRGNARISAHVEDGGLGCSSRANLKGGVTYICNPCHYVTF